MVVFLKGARSAALVTILFLLPPVVSGATETVGVTMQAQHYLSAFYAAGSAAYDNGIASILAVFVAQPAQEKIVARVGESSTLLLLGVAFLVLANRVGRRAPDRP